MGKSSYFVIILILLSIILPFIAVRVSAQTTPVPLSTLKDRAQKAYSYIVSLTRYFGGSIYAVIAEYPSVPIYVAGNGHWFVPGITYYNPSVNAYEWAELRDNDFISVQTGGNYYTVMWWYMDLKYQPSGGSAVTIATLYIEEHRNYENNAFNSWILVRVDYYNSNYASILNNLKVYYASTSLGSLTSSFAYMGYIPNSALPSMRTSVRHVDAIGTIARANLESGWNGALYNTITSIIYYVFTTDKGIYDIYNSMFYGMNYVGTVEFPNGYHFYDAQKFGGTYGYYKIWNWFANEKGVVFNIYPIYPYKSKLVAYAENLGINGGSAFLNILSLLGDPMYYAWMGLYYAYTEQYVLAYLYWLYMMQSWDGTGFYVSGQTGYSTVRLALGAILSSILAYKGYIPWDYANAMMNILVQLQWNGIGYYTKDGSTVYTIVKPDHRGGFITSYGKIGSYGYVPFRTPWIETILDSLIGGTKMPPEYLGIVPTNSETTIVALTAIMVYAKLYYGVSPPSLLT